MSNKNAFGKKMPLNVLECDVTFSQIKCVLFISGRTVLTSIHADVLPGNCCLVLGISAAALADDSR